MAAIKQLRKIVNESLSGRVRVLIAWVFSVWLVLVANQYPNKLGIAIGFLGATLRFWASGFLRKDSSLSVGGPYRFTRNPLYLGTFLIALGGVVSVNAWIIGVSLTLFFFFVYDVVIEFEETKLIGYFGDSYKKYCSLVPRFVGFGKPASIRSLRNLNSNEEAFSFSLKVAKKNKAMEAYWSWIGIFLFITLIVYAKLTWMNGQV
ncbi:MAG: isoprenylcysteine carboxylmethyltransferase family protein [Xanthomonadaceae bacterium]|nr:isoprenylcysteine carboxylmethyltransferase family protein [Xanthomonadaceae bacterium]